MLAWVTQVGEGPWAASGGGMSYYLPKPREDPLRKVPGSPSPCKHASCSGASPGAHRWWRGCLPSGGKPGPPRDEAPARSAEAKREAGLEPRRLAADTIGRRAQVGAALAHHHSRAPVLGSLFLGWGKQLGKRGALDGGWRGGRDSPRQT